MGSLQTEIEKTLSTWSVPKVQNAYTIFKKAEIKAKTVFNFVRDNPSCTVNDVAEATNMDTGRTSATLLALYERGKLGRKEYPNPDPNGKRHYVYCYWADVENFEDKAVSRKSKKPSKGKVGRPPKHKAEEELFIPKPEPVQVPKVNMLEAVFAEAMIEDKTENRTKSIENFVQNLNVHDAKKIYQLLKRIFE